MALIVGTPVHLYAETPDLMWGTGGWSSVLDAGCASEGFVEFGDALNYNLDAPDVMPAGGTRGWYDHRDRHHTMPLLAYRGA